MNSNPINSEVNLPALLLLIFGLCCSSFCHAADMSLRGIQQRIQPVGRVFVEAADTQVDQKKPSDAPSTTPTTAKTGKQIYDQYCMACHTTGAAGAPKLGDKAAWQIRFKTGLATLNKHAIQGYKLMPAKGGCATCSEKDIKNAVKYILDETGLK